MALNNTVYLEALQKYYNVMEEERNGNRSLRW